jgi:hypothetical protein
VVGSRQWGINVSGNENRLNGNRVEESRRDGIIVSGQRNNLHGNTSVGNGGLDMVDENPDCDDNDWKGNRFETSKQACIR